MEYIQVQVSSIIILFSAGIIWGGFFDAYRVWRGRRKNHSWVAGLGDICFWLLSLFLLIPPLFWASWLEIRFYTWLILTSGAIVYFCWFSSYVIQLYLQLIHWSGWLPRQWQKLRWQIRQWLKR